MKKVLFLLLAVVGLSLAFSSTAKAQTTQRKKVAVTAQPVTEKKDLPGPDGGVRQKKTRGYCYAYFDNYTGYYVDIY
jgi:hypothetical protein